MTQARSLALHLMDVHEHDDRAINLVLRGAVRADTQQVPTALLAAHFAFLQLHRLDYFCDEIFELGQFDRSLDVTDRPSRIRRQQIQKFGGGRRKAPDAHIDAQDNHRHIGAAEEIGKVVGEAAELDVAVLQLLVDRRQLFIDGLQLFLRRFELFVSALQLLVR